MFPASEEDLAAAVRGDAAGAPLGAQPTQRHWVLRLRPVDQAVMDRLRASLETLLNNAVAEQEKNGTSK